MSFNQDQLDHMRSLSAMDPATKCWCGWFPVGQCRTCPKDKSAADKIEAWCPSCNNAPLDYSRHGFIIHRMGCATRAAK